MFTNFPVNFINTLSLLSLGNNFACRYAPGTSYVPTSLSSYASINKETINVSNDAVGAPLIHLVSSIPLTAPICACYPFYHTVPLLFH